MTFHPASIERQTVFVLDEVTGPKFLDAMCAGAAPTCSQSRKALGFPALTGNKARDLAASFAHIDAGFASKVGK